MKNNVLNFIKSLLLFITIPFVGACKKDTNIEKDNPVKAIKLTIEHAGDRQYHKGYLSVNSTFNKNQKRVTVNGASWDDSTSEGETTLY